MAKPSGKSRGFREPAAERAARQHLRLVRCGQCGADNDTDRDKCWKCGWRLPSPPPRIPHAKDCLCVRCEDAKREPRFHGMPDARRYVHSALAATLANDVDGGAGYLFDDLANDADRRRALKAALSILGHLRRKAAR